MKFRDKDISLTFHPDTVKWTVEKPLIAWWGTYSLQVPAGFETDLASIPRRLRGVVSQVGRHIQAAIFHDAAYAGVFDGMTKAEADRMFLDGMVALEVPWYRRKVMYWAVRLGGASSWRGG